MVIDQQTRLFWSHASTFVCHLPMQVPRFPILEHMNVKHVPHACTTPAETDRKLPHPGPALHSQALLAAKSDASVYHTGIYYTLVHITHACTKPVEAPTSGSSPAFSSAFLPATMMYLMVLSTRFSSFLMTYLEASRSCADYTDQKVPNRHSCWACMHRGMRDDAVCFSSCLIMCADAPRPLMQTARVGQLPMGKQAASAWSHAVHCVLQWS